MRLVTATLFSVLLPSLAAAQDGGLYLQAGPLLDALLTTGGDGDPRAVLPSDPLREISTQTFAPGVSVAGGFFAAPSISLRVEGSFQGKHVTTRETEGLQPTTATTQEESSVTDLMVAVGWHQGESRTAGITLLAGMVLRHRHDDTLMQINYPAFVVRTGTGPDVTFTEPTTVEQQFDSTAYSAGVMAGLDIPVKLSDHLAIVPQVRVVAANHDVSLRPAVSLRWRP
jgi:hypothetical protein